MSAKRKTLPVRNSRIAKKPVRRSRISNREKPATLRDLVQALSSISGADLQTVLKEVRNVQFAIEREADKASKELGSQEKMIANLGLAIGNLSSTISSVFSRLGHVETRLTGLVREFIDAQREQLAMFACWSRIDDEQAQRLMSVSGGDVTPLYVEWFIETHTKAEVMAKYESRFNHLPPYLREKIKALK